MEDTELSYHNRCRLCIAESRLSLKIFDSEAIKMDLVDKIRCYLSIHISMDDGLPQQVCYECLSQIELFHCYKQSCIEAQHTLRNWDKFCTGKPAVDNDVPNCHDQLQIENEIIDEDDGVDARVPENISSHVGNSKSPPSAISSSKEKEHSVQNTRCKMLNRREKNQSSGKKGKKADDVTKGIIFDFVGEAPDATSTPVSSPQKNESSKRRYKIPLLKRVENNSEVHCQNTGEMGVTYLPRIVAQWSLAEYPDTSMSNNVPNFHLQHNKDIPRTIDNFHSESNSQSSLGQNCNTSRSNSPSSRTVSKVGRQFFGSGEQSGKQPSLRAPNKQSNNAVFRQHNKRSQEIRRRSCSPLPNRSPSVNKENSRSSVAAKNLGNDKCSQPVAVSSRKGAHKELKHGGGLQTTTYDENLGIMVWLKEQNDRDMYVQEETPSTTSEDQSTQDLLRILECDDDNVLFFPDATSSPETHRTIAVKVQKSSPSDKKNVVKDPANAYVRLEKLSSLLLCSEDELKVKNKPKPQRSPNLRARVQSNQYRFLKQVVDENGKVRYKCMRCSSLLSHKYYMKEHMKIHTGVKAATCLICGKAFRNKYMVRSHMAVHEDEKKFECEVCKHRFKSKERLYHHSRQHTLKFACPICGHLTNQKQALKRHLRKHTGERPYKCDLCEKAFADRTTYVCHRRIHTGERPYKCHQCDKRFARPVNLTAHMKTHSEIRPFDCHLCPNKFKTKAHLVKHLSCMHKDVMLSVVNFMKDEEESTVL